MVGPVEKLAWVEDIAECAPHRIGYNTCHELANRNVQIIDVIYCFPINSTSTGVEKAVKPKEKKEFVCRICGKVFTSHNCMLKQHIAIVHEGKRYPCKIL